MKRKELERLPVMGIEVTQVKIYPFDTSGIGRNVKAIASVTLNGIVEIKGINVVRSNKGYFIQMPTRKTHSGEFMPIVNILNKDIYLHIRRKVLDEYERMVRRYDEKVNNNS